MAYSKENYDRVKQEIAGRRQRAFAEYEMRAAETASTLPEAYELNRKIAMTGPKILDAAMEHRLDDDALESIKKENAALREKLRRVLEKNGYPADYLEVKYTCEKCGDTGYVGIDMCSCMKEALARAEFQSSGLSRLAETQSFETFDLSFYTGRDLDLMKINLERLREFTDNFSEETSDSFILLGATGLGKTHLSTSVAARVIERGYSVIYESAQDVISTFEQIRFGRDYSSGRDKEYQDCDLLIIDDLGVEVSNQFTVSCIYNVINSRLVRGKPTIINTNLSQGEMRQRYADRITSRIFGEFRPLLFTGLDVRQQKIGRAMK
ncbi:MAG: ATP-binding protein [Clostridia bacterium]|nr:ATP-binding protein [Clostridia bacterium]